MIGRSWVAAVLALAGASPMIAQRDVGGELSTPWGARRYTVHLPPERFGSRRPVVLVLHGCLQDAAAIAAGTGFSVAADSLGFIVIYPEQSPSVNPFRCWQWYDAAHQARDAGEPAVLAELARSTARQYGADSARIHVAGISAGGAMAVTLLATYPELFAAGAAHSAVPYRAATNALAGLKVMRKGAAADTTAVRDLVTATGGAVPPRLLVLHGSRDTIVAPGNARALAGQWRGAVERIIGRPLRESLAAVMDGPTHEWNATATTYGDGGNARIELWLVGTLGHAWSGGSKEGSFTDPAGPSATALMLRFFGLGR